jgi:glyoxylase-like metal-dependent hydrolase (beta-lactamase superfamily II)
LKYNEPRVRHSGKTSRIAFEICQPLTSDASTDNLRRTAMASTETPGLGRFGILIGSLLLLAGTLCLGREPQTAVSAVPGTPDKFEVYAVRYATSPGFKVSLLVVGADPVKKQDLPFMFWVLKGRNGRNVLIDAGSYHGAGFDRWKLADTVNPAEAIAKVGLKANDVTDVIVTHIHWDHINGLDLFGKARAWIQRDEFEHYVDAGGKPRLDEIEVDDAAMLAGLKKSGRLQFVDGDAKQIIPGITVYTGGRHTHSAQFVGVSTASGTVVVASDNIYMYENLEKRLPLGLTEDREADLRAMARMLTIASSPRLIVPGHDAAVFDRFPKPGAGIARID